MRIPAALTFMLLVAACGGASDNATPPPKASPEQPREDPLPAFEDTLGVAKGLDLPALTDYWRAAAEMRLPAPPVVDPELPLLGVRIAADGSLTTRGRDDAEWTAREDDRGFMQVLQRNAGEIDFDTGAAELQIVLAMDRTALWQTFLGVLEMMRTTGCHRLLVVANDAAAPALRLIDLSLPVESLPVDTGFASIDLQREGIVGDQDYKVTLHLGGNEESHEGPRFPESLRAWAAAQKADPDVLILKLPRDEPFGTLFTMLNAATPLGMNRILIGG